MGRQAAAVAGHLCGLGGGDHGVEIDTDLDTAAHVAGVDGVVVGVDPHVVVPGQAGRPPQRRVWQHRREGEHGAAVLGHGLPGPDLGGGVDSVVGLEEPPGGFQPAQLEAWFAALPPGNLTTRPGTRGDLFYHRPGADAETIALDERTKETVSGAERATLGQASEAAVSEAISVPVLSVVGEYDNVFCPSSCAVSSSPASAEAQHYPNAPCFSSAITPAAGHAVNRHRTASHFFALARTWVMRLDRSPTLCR